MFHDDMIKRGESLKTTFCAILGFSPPQGLIFRGKISWCYDNLNKTKTKTGKSVLISLILKKKMVKFETAICGQSINNLDCNLKRFEHKTQSYIQNNSFITI